MIAGLAYLDVALLAILAISGMVAMYRGLTRELLSIVSWAVAAGAVVYFIRYHRAFAEEVAKQFSNPVQTSYIYVAQVAIGGLIFLVVLVIVNLITSRISDSVLDSRVGAIDRILGFAFGILRGFVLVVIPYMFYESFVPNQSQQAPWVRDAVSRPYIQATGKSLYSVLVRLVPPQLLPPGEQQHGRLFPHFHSPLVAPRGQSARLVLYPGRPTDEDS
ncbi:MAG TPA: CvpA family protein [Hyphomicrobiaceae bacterium]|nr:CvpA family protein [Hyphomicrobiaceae bacterium]